MTAHIQHQWVPNVSQNSINLDAVKRAFIQITENQSKKIGMAWVPQPKNP
jgi:hypothetical protein